MNHFYRTISLLIYGLLFMTYLQPAVAQQKKEDKVTINIRNGTLEEIIQAVMKQTAVKIVYNQELVQKSPRQSFSAKAEPLKVLMKRLLKGSQLTFVVLDNVMVIGPKEESDEEPKINNIIKGMVTDEKGNPLFLVTVNVTGTPSNTISNEEGKFSIDLPEGKSLTFSSVGFQKKIIKPVPGEPLMVKLTTELKEMEELVVTGYQQINKRLSASSTVTLQGKDIKDPGATNIVSMLQGKVAGLSVVKNSGSPNAIPSMRMRGTSTLLGNANPIIVVDGVIRENPNEINPDNLLGIEPSPRDAVIMKTGILAKGSLTGNAITGLNVNDVESITFLKDASATAIYGTRAANGVIVITTKKGKNGAMAINYNSNFGTSRKPNYGRLQLMNSQQRVRFSREMYEDGYVYKTVPVKMGYEGSLLDLFNRKISETEFRKEVAALESMNTDWFDLLFRNTFNVGQHISFSGGNEKTNYYSSLSYNDNKGTAKLDDLKEGSAALDLSTELSKRLKFGLKLNGSYRVSNGYFGINPLDYALKTSRAISPSLTYPVVEDLTPEIPGASIDYNFLHEVQQTASQVKDTKLNVALDLSYQLMQGLKLSALAAGSINTLNATQSATEFSYYVGSLRGYNYGTVAPGGPEEQFSAIPFGGVLFPSTSSVYTYNIRNMAEFNRNIFSTEDQLNVIAGMEIRSVHNEGLDNLIPGYFRDRGEGFYLSRNSLDLLSPKRTNTIDNALSLFSTATYSYAGKYILNGNMRTDASNRFGQYANQRFLPIWSIAGRWNAGSEKWLQGNKIVNDLYLKASYGFQGNVIRTVGPDLILMANDGTAAMNDVAKEFYLKIKSMPYPDLKWEKTKSVNLELGGSLFNSFLNFNLGYYRKQTSDAIVSRFIPVEYGVTKMLVNGGNIMNHGYELQLGLNLINTENLSWTMSVNGAKNFNVLQKGTLEATQTRVMDYVNGNIFVENQPVGTIYAFSFKGLNPENGFPMFHGTDDEGDKRDRPSFIDYLKPVGTRNAKINGGLNTNISYKAFSVGASFAFRLGSVKFRNPVYDPTSLTMPGPAENLPVILAERWRKPGDELYTDIPAFPREQNRSLGGYVYLKNYTSMSRYEMYTYSDVNVVSGSFLRCNTVDLSYRFNEGLLKRIRLKQASVSGGISNLFTIADKKLRGQDPEIDGVGTTALPIPKIFTLGLNVTF
ncbi:SusC/RagA family TonB-linked outer membrane protein [Pedobacter nyackensis]|uniref:SusC/RagA family TonB-linked outer membrane protein n=1 Tax=Pedobacter nyackensis TaxID=475255 RepID=UPI00292FC7ED|nr:SusC/RagA family TonB-linked outer membrane protein [Pedobacter nyackensis]